jgi:hypothetical protein
MYIDPYTDPDPEADPTQGSNEGGTSRDPEQRRHERVASPDVATEGPRLRWTDRAAFDADVSTLPIPGMFASPRMARKLGYRIIDAHRGDGPIGRTPLTVFDDWVAELQASIEREGSMTSEAQCRQTMADCIVQRTMRDRAWDAEAADADRHRRRERR